MKTTLGKSQILKLIVLDEEQPNGTNKNSFLPLDGTRELLQSYKYSSRDNLEPSHKYAYEQQRLTSVKEISTIFK